MKNADFVRREQWRPFGGRRLVLGIAAHNPEHPAGTPCLPELLRAVVFYHGVAGWLADTMVKVSQNGTSVVVV